MGGRRRPKKNYAPRFSVESLFGPCLLLQPGRQLFNPKIIIMKRGRAEDQPNIPDFTAGGDFGDSRNLSRHGHG
jgi:hypothetical protein